MQKNAKELPADTKGDQRMGWVMWGLEAKDDTLVKDYHLPPRSAEEKQHAEVRWEKMGWDNGWERWEGSCLTCELPSGVLPYNNSSTLL